MQQQYLVFASIHYIRQCTWPVNSVDRVVQHQSDKTLYIRDWTGQRNTSVPTKNTTPILVDTPKENIYLIYDFHHPSETFGDKITLAGYIQIEMGGTSRVWHILLAISEDQVKGLLRRVTYTKHNAR